jgi:hypothetical protein
MKAFFTTPLILFLLISCCSTTPFTAKPDRRVEQLLGPAVHVLVGGKRAGSGTVVAAEDGSVILTAHHVVAPAIADPSRALSVFVETEEGFVTKAAQVVASDEATDVAVLIVGVRAKYVAQVWKGGDVPLFSKCYAVGISPLGIPISNHGEVLALKDGLYYVDAFVYFGYSGGGLFVEEDGDWKLAGVLVGVGSLGPYPLFNLGVVVDVRLALVALKSPR